MGRFIGTTYVMDENETIDAIRSVALEGIQADGNNDLMYNALLEIASLCGADIEYNYRHNKDFENCILTKEERMKTKEELLSD